MKSKYFSTRYQASQIRGTREKSAPRKTNWDRIVYMTFLIGVLIFVGYYLTQRIFYISGDGRVVIEKVVIRSPGDIRVDRLFAATGNPVSRGDTLFSFSFQNWELQKEAREELLREIERINLDIASVEDQILLKEQEIESALNRISYLEELQQNYQDRVRLDLATHLELTEVSTALFEANEALVTYRAELSVLRDSRNRQAGRISAAEERLQFILEGRGPESYTSPVAGVVQELWLGESQEAFRTDEILSILPNDADVYILSLFKRKDAPGLMPGTLMDIHFDSGEKSFGLIRKTYDPRQNNGDEINQMTELQNDHMVVELIPADESARRLWLKMDRSGVEVRKSQFSRKRSGKLSDEPGENNPSALHNREKEGDVNLATLSTNRAGIGRLPGKVEETDEQSGPGIEQDDTGLTQPRDAEEKAGSDSQQLGDGTTPATPSHLEKGEAQAASESQPYSDFGLFGGQFAAGVDGFSIIVASLNKKELADDTASQLKEEGYRVAVVPAMVNGVRYHRVALGQFETENSALEAAASIPPALAEDYYIRKMNKTVSVR